MPIPLILKQKIQSGFVKDEDLKYLIDLGKLDIMELFKEGLLTQEHFENMYSDEEFISLFESNKLDLDELLKIGLFSEEKFQKIYKKMAIKKIRNGLISENDIINLISEGVLDGYELVRDGLIPKKILERIYIKTMAFDNSINNPILYKPKPTKSGLWEVFWSKISALFTSSRAGKILYAIPAKMAIKQNYACLLRIAYHENVIIQDLAQEIENTKIEDIQISGEMEVEIFDIQEAFVIKMISNKRQFIEPNEAQYTEWKFYVMPYEEKIGVYPLLLRVTAIFRIGKKEVRKDKVFDKVVEVTTVSQGKVENLVFESANEKLNFSEEKPNPVLEEIVTLVEQIKIDKFFEKIDSLLPKEDAIVETLRSKFIMGIKEHDYYEQLKVYTRVLAKKHKW